MESSMNCCRDQKEMLTGQHHVKDSENFKTGIQLLLKEGLKKKCVLSAASMVACTHQCIVSRPSRPLYLYASAFSQNETL